MAMYDFRLDMDLLTTISFNKMLQEVREGLDDGILEKFVKENILESDGALLGSTRRTPNATKADQKQRQELDELKASLSEEEKQKLIDETQELLVYQQTEDSPEAKATILAVAR